VHLHLRRKHSRAVAEVTRSTWAGFVEERMPAYVIFIRERTLDQSELDTYAKAVEPLLEGLPVRFLAAYGRQKVLEGPAPEGVAIAEFPSLEEACRWYESPAYQAAAQHRFKGATYRGIIVEGL
jgi:uncharacterized protein (DUF1330 family)